MALGPSGRAGLWRGAGAPLPGASQTQKRRGINRVPRPASPPAPRGTGPLLPGRRAVPGRNALSPGRAAEQLQQARRGGRPRQGGAGPRLLLGPHGPARPGPHQCARTRPAPPPRLSACARVDVCAHVCSRRGDGRVCACPHRNVYMCVYIYRHTHIICVCMYVHTHTCRYDCVRVYMQRTCVCVCRRTMQL